MANVEKKHEEHLDALERKDAQIAELMNKQPAPQMSESTKAELARLKASDAKHLLEIANLNK